MELEFTLQEPDLHALVQHQIQRSPLVPRRINRLKLGYTIGFALLALGTFIYPPDRPLSPLFATLAVLAFFLHPSIARRRLKASVPRLVRQRMTESSLGHRRLKALPDGLQKVSPNSQSKVTWALVGPPETTQTHVFIPIDGVYSVVIPTSAVSGEALHGFLEAVSNYRKAVA
jgi:hypothetical protein